LDKKERRKKYNKNKIKGGCFHTLKSIVAQVIENVRRVGHGGVVFEYDSFAS